MGELIAFFSMLERLSLYLLQIRGLEYDTVTIGARDAKQCSESESQDRGHDMFTCIGLDKL
jgi:hypothetical protein